jgi:hypothetical protein
MSDEGLDVVEDLDAGVGQVRPHLARQHLGDTVVAAAVVAGQERDRWRPG